jgi:hypothetical protein
VAVLDHLRMCQMCRRILASGARELDVLLDAITNPADDLLAPLGRS